MTHVMHHVGLLVGGRCPTMSCVGTMAAVARVGITGHLVACRIADMCRDEFTTAVVAAIDNALADGFKSDSRFVVMHRCAPGNVVHGGMMHTRQCRELSFDARRAQGGHQFAHFDGACSHDAYPW